ncbi:MAG: MFS transporter [Bacteroidales bacterium]
MDKYIITDKRRYWTMMAVICFGAMMTNLDATAIIVCLPTIAGEMNLSPSHASVIVLAYLLFETAPLMVFGKIGDIFGGRRVLLIGFALFTLSSFFCGTTSSLWQLIVMRSLQGVGGAMIISVMVALATLHSPASRKGQAVGYIMMTAALGVSLGPTVGGFIANYFGWRYIFFINVPLGIVAIAAGYFFLPGHHPPAPDRRFDLLGAFYQTAFLLLLIFAVNQGLEYGWTSLRILSAFGGSLIMVLLFIRRELKIDNPIIDLKLFTNRNTLFSSLNLCLSMMVFGGVLFLMPFFLSHVYGLKANIIGTILSLIAFGQFLGPFAGRLGDRKGHRNIILAGVFLGLLAFVMFFIIDFGEPLWWVILALVVFSISQGLNKAPNIQLMLKSVPPEKNGVTSSMTGLLRSLGLVLGVVLFETALSEFIPASVSLNGYSLGNSGVEARLLHEGFILAFSLGIVISLIMIILMSSMKKTPKAITA